MRAIVAAIVAASIIATPTLATPISLSLDDGAQRAAAELPAMIDQCVASLMLRKDAEVCSHVSKWMAALANEVRTQQAVAAKAASEEATKKAVADKKAIDDAAAKKATDAAPVENPEAPSPK